MRRFVQAWVIWSLVWVVLLAVAYFMSEGEPVCKGPLILSVDDSDPPQCPDPSAALLTVGFVLYLVGIVPSMAIAAVVGALESRRTKHS